MVHNAFDSVQVLKDCPVKIESVGLWGRRLVLGCIDGSLRIFAPEDESDALPSESSSAAVPSYVVRDTRVGFAKKAVTAMNVLQSRGLLITLSDGVAINTLPGFEVVSYSTKTKGANLYAWDGDQGLLAVAKQKRIFVYRYDGNRDFTEIKDLAAPDVVKAMDWSNDSLCLGIRKEYVILNINSGVTIDVFPCGRISGPSVVALPQGELLLGKDNIGVIVDHNGKVFQDGGLSWSEAPTTVAIHYPYALARLSRFIEVRSLRAPYGLVQMLALRDINLLLSTDAGLVAATDHSVYRILPVALSVQVVQLAASGNFEDALALCKMFPPEDSALRAAKEDAIHTRYGHHLFEQGDYVEAMEHFGASSLDLISILSLFPSIKVARANPLRAPQSTENKDIEDAHEKKKSMAALSGFLMGKRGAVASKAEAEETDAAVAAMVEGVSAKESPAETIPFRKTDSDEVGQYNARELATVLDTALVQALLSTDTSQVALQLVKGPNYCDVTSCKEMMLAGGHYAELLELYRSNKMHHEALRLLQRLLDKSDSLDVQPEEGQFGAQDIVDYLMRLGDQDPTFILESSEWVLKNNPDQALLLFTSFSPPLPMNLVLAHLKEHAPELQVFYLENMLGKRAESGGGAPADLQSELMQLYLARVLDERSELLAQGKWDEKLHSEAREKLLRALHNSKTYSPGRMLQKLPPDGLYEERAFLLGQLGQHQLALTLCVHKLHQPELALAYCDRVYQSATSNRKSTKANIGFPAMVAASDQAAVNIYLTLLEVYLKQKAAIREYDKSIASLAPRATLAPSRSFPSPKPSPGQKGKGQVASKIAEIEKAEESKYSSTDSAADSSSRSETEELTGGATASSDECLLDDALKLLSNRWDRFDGARALRLLPSDTKLENLLPFLEPMLRTTSEAYRNSAVIKSLHRSESLQVREELFHTKRRGVTLTSEQKCSICNKRIGTSVFAVYPNGTLAHFVCYRDVGQPTATGS